MDAGLTLTEEEQKAAAANAPKEPVTCAKILNDVKTSPRRFLDWKAHLYKTFGRDVILTMCTVYVMQGVRGAFLEIAIDYFYTDPVNGIGVSAGIASEWKSLASWPWNVKPLYGLLADLVPIYGSHRKWWLIIWSVLGGLFCCLLLFTPMDSPDAALFICVCCFLNNIAVAFCDVLADAMTAQYAKLETGRGAGNLQVAVFASQNAGKIIFHMWAGVRSCGTVTPHRDAVSRLCPPRRAVA
jgi:MFS family permease|eukprot:COSAG06_NODE_1620_length_8905_cov_255.644788_8_plen_241_part_00